MGQSESCQCKQISEIILSKLNNKNNKKHLLNYNELSREINNSNLPYSQKLEIINNYQELLALMNKIVDQEKVPIITSNPINNMSTIEVYSNSNLNSAQIDKIIRIGEKYIKLYGSTLKLTEIKNIQEQNNLYQKVKNSNLISINNDFDRHDNTLELDKPQYVYGLSKDTINYNKFPYRYLVKNDAKIIKNNGLIRLILPNNTLDYLSEIKRLNIFDKKLLGIIKTSFYDEKNNLSSLFLFVFENLDINIFSEYGHINEIGLIFADNVYKKIKNFICNTKLNIYQSNFDSNILFLYDKELSFDQQKKYNIKEVFYKNLGDNCVKIYKNINNYNPKLYYYSLNNFIIESEVPIYDYKKFKFQKLMIGSGNSNIKLELTTEFTFSNKNIASEHFDPFLNLFDKINKHLDYNYSKFIYYFNKVNHYSYFNFMSRFIMNVSIKNPKKLRLNYFYDELNPVRDLFLYKPLTYGFFQAYELIYKYNNLLIGNILEITNNPVFTEPVHYYLQKYKSIGKHTINLIQANAYSSVKNTPIQTFFDNIQQSMTISSIEQLNTKINLDWINSNLNKRYDTIFCSIYEVIPNLSAFFAPYYQYKIIFGQILYSTKHLNKNGSLFIPMDAVINYHLADLFIILQKYFKFVRLDTQDSYIHTKCQEQ